MSDRNIPTDLVVRIREHAGAYLFPKTADALLKEAADEIERLEGIIQRQAVRLFDQPDDEEALSRG